MQIMTAVVPSLEKLSQEGDEGRRKISQYTRYLTMVLSLIQGFWDSIWYFQYHDS